MRIQKWTKVDTIQFCSHISCELATDIYISPFLKVCFQGATMLADRLSCVLQWVIWNWLCPGQASAANTLPPVSSIPVKGSHIAMQCSNSSLNLLDENGCLSTSILIHK